MGPWGSQDHPLGLGNSEARKRPAVHSAGDPSSNLGGPIFALLGEKGSRPKSRDPITFKRSKSKMESLNKYQNARLIGARALQISLGAPVLVSVPKNMVEPLDIAKLELEKDAMPIIVKKE